MSYAESSKSGRVIIKAGSIFYADKGFTAGRTLLLKDGAVERMGSSFSSADASEVFDFRNFTICPPFCDYHLHFTKHAVEHAEETAFSLISHGIMSAMDGGERDSSGIRMRKTAGSMMRVETAGSAIYKKGGYGRLIGTGAGDAKEAFRIIDRLKKTGVDYIKLINSGVFVPDSGMISDGGFGSNEIREIISYAADSGLNVYCHANGDYAIRHAVEAGACCIIHGFSVSDETLFLMKERGASLIPTLTALQRLSLNNRSAESLRNISAFTERHLAAVSKAVGLGIRVLPGSDAGPGFLPYGSAYLDELRFLSRAGMPTDRIISVSVQGEIAEGGRADFIVLDGIALKAVFAFGQRLA